MNFPEATCLLCLACGPEPLGMAPLKRYATASLWLDFQVVIQNSSIHKSSLVVDERSVSAFSKALCICLTDTKYMSNAKAQVPILRRRFSMDNHMKSLNDIFNTCLNR